MNNPITTILSRLTETAGWFENMSPEAQKSYIAKNPNSKYAKGAGPNKPNDTKVKTTPVKPKGTPAKENDAIDSMSHDELKKHATDLRDQAEGLRNNKGDIAPKNMDKYLALMGEAKKAGILRDKKIGMSTDPKDQKIMKDNLAISLRNKGGGQATFVYYGRDALDKFNKSATKDVEKTGDSLYDLMPPGLRKALTEMPENDRKAAVRSLIAGSPLAYNDRGWDLGVTAHVLKKLS